jgi:hypothetical protein
MKRLILALPLMAGCISWDALRDSKLNSLDAGEMPDASAPDSGEPDSGTPDSGTPDAGCAPGVWCMTSRWVGGTRVRSVIPDGQGHFLAISGADIFNTGIITSIVSWDAGVYTAAPVPNFLLLEGGQGSIEIPTKIALNKGVVAIASEDAISALLDLRTSTILVATQNYNSASQNQEVNDVAWLDDQTAAFAGRTSSSVAPHLCRLTIDGGTHIDDFTGYSTGAAFLSAITLMPSGNLYIGDSSGSILMFPVGASSPAIWQGMTNTDAVLSIAGPDESTMFANHTTGNDLETYQGDGGWKEALVPLGAGLSIDYSRLWFTSATDGWLGGRGAIFHYNGAWSAITLDGVDPDFKPDSIAATGPDDIAIAGYEIGSTVDEGRLYVYHRN